MANPLFLPTDLSSFSLTATTTDANFPLSNLQSYFARDVWKSGNLATTPQDVVFNFGAAVSCDFLVLDSYVGGGDVNSSVSLQAANDVNFSSGLVTPIGAGTIDAGATPPSKAYFLFTGVSRQYWRLRFASSSPPFPSLIIGNVFLGSRLDWGFPYDFNYKDGVPSFNSFEAEMLDGSIRTSQSFGNRQRWRIDFAGAKGGVSNTVRANFQTFMRTVRGKLRPFYYVDTDGTTISLVHLDIDADPSEPMRYNVNDIKGIMMKSQLTS